MPGRSFTSSATSFTWRPVIAWAIARFIRRSARGTVARSSPSLRRWIAFESRFSMAAFKAAKGAVDLRAFVFVEQRAVGAERKLRRRDHPLGFHDAFDELAFMNVVLGVLVRLEQHAFNVFVGETVRRLRPPRRFRFPWSPRVRSRAGGRRRPRGT